MTLSVMGVSWLLQRKVLSAVLVGAGAGNVGVTGDDAFFQTRDGGHHLKGGAGGYTPEVARFTSG